MATTPTFASTPIVGTGIVPGTADTSDTSPTNQTTLTWSTAIGANGAKVEQIDAVGLGTTVAGLVNLFLFDGTTYHRFDYFTVTAVTESTTAGAFTFRKSYTNLWLPNGWSLRVTNTVAGNVSLIKVIAYAANF